ncbi:MAG: hypothetical protein KDK90_22285 [Leptospiraceae bacterium]|nr:hypothetical protein [Leptospiraceae bacterium]
MVKIFLGICIGFFSLNLTTSVLKSHLEIGTDSDLLYPASLIEDVVQNQPILWNLPPSPNFFPDIFLFGIFRILTGNTFYAYYFHSFIFALLLWYSFYIMFGNLFFSFLMITGILLFFTFLPDKFGIFFFSGYHGTIFILLPILYFFLFEKANPNFISPRTKIYLYTLFCLVLSSDSHSFSQFLIPAFFSYLTLCLFRKSRFYIPLYLILFTCLSFLVVHAIKYIKIFRIPDVPIVSATKTVIQNKLLLTNLQKGLNLFWNDRFGFGENAIYFYLWLFLGLLTLGLLLVIFIKSKGKKEDRRLLFTNQEWLLVLFFLYSTLISLGIQFILGVWMGSRYVWAMYLFPFIIFPLLLNKWKENDLLLYVHCGFLVLLYFMLPAYQSIYKQFPINKDVRCVLEYAIQKKAVFGISNYWYAKYLTLASANQLKMYQITENLETYHWINNTIPFRNVVYNLVISNDLPEDAIFKKWKIPDEKFHCGKIRLLYYQNGIQYFD